MRLPQASGRICACHAIGVLAAFLLTSACSQADQKNRKLEVEQLVSRPVALGYRAYDTEWAVIIAPDASVASTFAEEVRSAAASFYTMFGVRVPPGCVRVIGAPTITQCRTDAPWTMDWPSSEDEHRPNTSSSYWRQVDFGVLRDTLNNRSASALGDRSLCEAGYHPIVRTSQLRHELMHQFFIKLLWPNNKGSEQYGGGAPDWLDEAAAIAGEPPYLVRSRRARFMKMLADGTVIPMDRFLRMEHPIMASMRQRPSVAKEGQTTVIVVRQSSTSGEGLRLLNFYAQVRAFSDYLATVSNDRRVLRLVTTQLKEQKSPVQIANFSLDKNEIEEGFLAWVRAQNWGTDDAVCA